MAKKDYLSGKSGRMKSDWSSNVAPMSGRERGEWKPVRRKRGGAIYND